MTIEVDTITLPACWASALVNGDYSGLEGPEIVALNAHLASTFAAGWSVVDVARDENGEAIEPSFSWSYGLYGGTAQGGDVLDYVIHRVK